MQMCRFCVRWLHLLHVVAVPFPCHRLGIQHHCHFQPPQGQIDNPKFAWLNYHGHSGLEGFSANCGNCAIRVMYCCCKISHLHARMKCKPSIKLCRNCLYIVFKLLGNEIYCNGILLFCVQSRHSALVQIQQLQVVLLQLSSEYKTLSHGISLSTSLKICWPVFFLIEYTLENFLYYSSHLYWCCCRCIWCRWITKDGLGAVGRIFIGMA